MAMRSDPPRRSIGIRVLSTEPIVISETEMREAMRAATGQDVLEAKRFTDGALSVSYKVATKEEQGGGVYVVQLRHHGDVTSMN